jgi:hypothetical protein
MVADTADGADGIVGLVLALGRYPDGPSSQPLGDFDGGDPGRSALATNSLDQACSAQRDNRAERSRF